MDEADMERFESGLGGMEGHMALHSPLRGICERKPHSKAVAVRPETKK
jgi:hypothetical protein